jgi:hypothetical protein
MRADIQRFRISPWPISAELLFPSAWPRWRYRLHHNVFEVSDPDGFEVSETADGYEMSVEHRLVPYAPDEEIYLQLAAVDLDDPRALLRFVNRYGILGVRFGRYAFFRDFPSFWEIERKFDEALGHIFGGYPSSADDWPDSAYRVLVLSEWIGEFHFGARCIRDLITAWKIVSKQLDLSAASWEALLPQDVPTDENEAAEFLATLVTPALKPFHPRLEVGPPEPAGRYGKWTLYSLCCLELFTHIAEGAVYRHCANSRCQRLFVRQHGRAKYGQHRSTGVLYCSTSCAKSQAQRNWRERKRRAEA